MELTFNKCGILFGVLLAIVNVLYSAPIGDGMSTESMSFLEKFGYLQKPDPKLGKLLSVEDVTKAIKSMQRYAGLPETGVLDGATSKLMNTSRCGMPDVGRADSARRKRRYNIQGSKWNKEELTWRIYNYGNDGLSKEQVRKTFANSLKKWSDVTNLAFKEITTGEPDIWFKFVRGAHGDPYPFAIPYSSVLAHAFYPMDSKMALAGDVHFNDDKRYTIESTEGKNLLWVTVHELGHSIGLDHSQVQGAIMYPYYQGYKGKDFDLTPDDIRGVQTLYGGKLQTTAKVEDKVTQKPVDDKCFSKMGSVFLGNDKKTYVFNSDKLFILKKDLGIEKGPIQVSKLFKGVKTVDAAFKRQKDHNTVLLSGKNYYVFSGDHSYISGPTPISRGFVGFPSDFGDIDGAFVWPGNNLLYFFKGDSYWRVYQHGDNYKVSPGYPRKISAAWGGIPNDIDGVFAWRNGVTYFFKGTEYYRLSNDLKVEPNYPKKITKAWAQLTYCPRAGSVIASDRNGATKSVSQITLVTSIMALMSLLQMTA